MCSWLATASARASSTRPGSVSSTPVGPRSSSGTTGLTLEGAQVLADRGLGPAELAGRGADRAGPGDRPEDQQPARVHAWHGATLAAVTAEILRYAAFTDDPQRGNPAGVVLDATGLSAEEMQGIAAEVGYSETAFVIPGDGPLATRYFSPQAEVDFCGHATIALAVARADRDGPGPLALDTAAGRIDVDVVATPTGPVATLRSVPTQHAAGGRGRPDGAALRPRLGAEPTWTTATHRTSRSAACTTRCSRSAPGSGWRTSTTTTTRCWR